MQTASVNRALRLVLIDSDKRARAYVRQVFNEHDVRVVGEADDIKSGMRFVRGLQPDVVLMELPENASETMEAIRKLTEEQPETGIILSRHDPSPQLILSAMRAGAQEFVSRPIDGTEVKKAIEHVRRQIMRTMATGSSRGTVISVFSSKGGVGSTSVVANLGVALAGHDEFRTILVDLNFQMGDLGVMLNLPARYSLADAQIEGRLDESRLRTVVSQHESGVDILTVATSPEIGEEITRHHLVDLFGTLGTMYDFIVVDVGRQMDDRTVEVLELSDEVFLLSTLDVPAVRNASRYLAMLDRLKIDRDRVRLIVNRFHKKARLSLKDVEAALGIVTFWSIPNDYEPISLGIDRGSPAVIESRRSKAARNFKLLAATIIKEIESPAPLTVPVETPVVTTKVERKEMEPVRVPERPSRTREEPVSQVNSHAHDSDLNRILGT